MNNQAILTKVIDDRNRDLWDSVSEKYSIDIQLSNLYNCYAEGDKATIYIDKDICPDSFTHEILHLYIGLKQVSLVGMLTLSIASSDKLRKILSRPLIEHIGNCFSHIKMLPRYLELGYDRQKFIEDYHQNKCTTNEIALIKNNFKISSRYYGAAVDQFIGKYIAIKADPNILIDYSTSLNELAKIDFDLYQVLENFYNDWLTLDIEVYDLFHNYRTVGEKFLEELNVWVSNKNIF